MSPSHGRKTSDSNATRHRWSTAKPASTTPAVGGRSRTLSVCPGPTDRRVVGISEPRLLSDQLSDYRLGDLYIQAELHGRSSRSVPTSRTHQPCFGRSGQRCGSLDGQSSQSSSLWTGQPWTLYTSAATSWTSRLQLVMRRSGVRFPEAAPCDVARHRRHLEPLIGFWSGVADTLGLVVDGWVEDQFSDSSPVVVWMMRMSRPLISIRTGVRAWVQGYTSPHWCRAACLSGVHAHKARRCETRGQRKGSLPRSPTLLR
jgi:hypothetical protein